MTNYNWIIKLLPPARQFLLAIKAGNWVAAAKAAVTLLVYAAVFSGIVVISTGCAELSLKTVPPPITITQQAPPADITVTPN